MARRLAITKKVSLAEFSEDWDDCYAIVRPASYQDFVDFTKLNLKDMEPSEQLEKEMVVVIDHFVAGKIRVLDDTGHPQLVDMEPDDIKGSVPMANKLLFEILGVKLDPKDSPKAAESISTP